MPSAVAKVDRLLPGGRCTAGLGFELATNRQFSSSFCRLHCAADLCTLRLARKFLRR